MQSSDLKHIIALAGLLLVTVSALNADEIDVRFNRAFNLLSKGEYSQAYPVLLQIQNDNANHPNADRNDFYLYKCRYYSGRYSECISNFRRFINRFGHSSYVPYAYFFLGNAYYRMENADKAIEAYVKSYSLSTDNSLDRLLISSINSGAANVSATALINVKSFSIPENKRCRLLIAISKAMMEQKNYQLVGTMLSTCRSVEAVDLVRRADRYLRQKAEIGIALPLSGEFQKYGEQILDGIRLRMEQYTSETGQKITPLVYDTRGDNLEAARVIKYLSDGGATAAIGPLTSDAGAIASAALACADLPLIIPVASQGGLTELSVSSFQLQPNLEWQGFLMADFARMQLGADTSAIITPTSPENLRMARAFKKRFEDLGGTILGVEYFRARDTDFGQYVRDLKSLIIGDLLDSIIFINESGDTIEAEEVPVWIDCIYIPAGANQLKQLLPQINFYNLNTVYLGGDGWGSGSVYKLGDRITKDCYFSSAVIEEARGEMVEQFATEFDLRYGKQPGRLEALGYDAMSLICLALHADSYARDEIRNFLSNIKDYRGIAGDVTFGEHRENIELPVYTIKGGAPIRVEIE